MADLNADVIRHALRTAREYGFREVKLKAGDAKFHARLDDALPAAYDDAAVGDDAPTSAVFETQALRDLTAPLVGYYREATPPLEIGKRIEKGDVVAIIAALGLANDVESPVTGEVVELLVANGQAVEYGQAIARVKGD
ncbi:MAG TPA: hypothetical protein PLH94_08655 [Fimbriimonadaceae bacterium]|nr:hypothetical protein [Fimbriimonadaceae bacterium]